MIILGLVLLIIGIWVARNILWPIAGILILLGLLLWIIHPFAYTTY